MRMIFIALFAMFLTPLNAKELTVILTSNSDNPTMIARLFTPYLIKELPGYNRVTFRVVPGAGGLNAANHIYTIAPRDGDTIGLLYKNVPLIGAVNRQDTNIKFDASQFFWLGSLVDGRKDASILISNKPYDNDITAGSDNNVIANPINFIQKYTNMKLKKITGYKEPNDVRLAMIRNEVNVIATSLFSTIVYDKEWITKYHVLVQFGNGRNRHPMLADVPTLNEMITDREAIEALTVVENQFALIRSYIAPPGIPVDRSTALRLAFERASMNTSFIEESRRLGVEISPILHEEAQAIVRKTYSTPERILNIIK